MKNFKYFWPVVLILFITGINSCKKESTGSLAVVKTYAPLYVASKSMTVGFRVESNGGSKITECGLYIGNAQNPESLGSKLNVASDTGTFYFQVNGLIPGTQFYMKAYAINSKGQALGEQETFTTPATISDFDNNSYETVIIENQTWMRTNLKTTRYMNGDPVVSTTPSTFDLTGESTPKYQWTYEVNGIPAAQEYGKLYTFYTITDSRKICPAGWHIPTDADWVTLENNLGGYTIAGSFLKESGNVQQSSNLHWSQYNLDATNITCFTALPGGYRNYTGSFTYLGNYGLWWSSTEADAANAWVRSLYMQSSQISKMNFVKKNGASVRCVKD